MEASAKDSIKEFLFYTSVVAIIGVIVTIAIKAGKGKSNAEGYEEIARAGGTSEDPLSPGNPSFGPTSWSSGKEDLPPAEPNHWANQR